MTLLLLLMVIWITLTAELSWANVGFGFFLSAGLLALTGQLSGLQSLGRRRRYILRWLWRMLAFIAFFLYELIAAGFAVFLAILNMKRLQPGVVAVPLDVRTDAEITLLANLITLTPGTLTLDVSSDRRAIYVHTMILDDPEVFRQGIKNGFERRVMELFQL